MGIDAYHGYVTPVLLFFLLFGMSGTVEVESVKTKIRSKKALVSGILMQFVIMPFTGFIAVISLTPSGTFTEAMGLSLLIVTTSPGGSLSNWIASLFNADLTLSVTMTSINTLLSSFLLPINLLLYTHLSYGVAGGESGSNVINNLEWGGLFISIGVVVSGILAGLAASYKFGSPKFHRRSNKFGSAMGTILCTYSLMISSGSDSAWYAQSWQFYVGMTLPPALGLGLANVIGCILKLESPERVTISIECSIQNVAIAATASLNMFDDQIDRDQALAVAIAYGIISMCLAVCYSFVSWKVGWTKAPADENFCVILTKTYEVDDDMGKQHASESIGGNECFDHLEENLTTADK